MDDDAADDDGDDGLAWTLPERKLQSKSKPVERIHHIRKLKVCAALNTLVLQFIFVLCYDARLTLDDNII